MTDYTTNDADLLRYHKESVKSLHDAREASELIRSLAEVSKRMGVDGFPEATPGEVGSVDFEERAEWMETISIRTVAILEAVLSGTEIPEGAKETSAESAKLLYKIKEQKPNPGAGLDFGEYFK